MPGPDPQTAAWPGFAGPLCVPALFTTQGCEAERCLTSEVGGWRGGTGLPGPLSPGLQETETAVA